MKPSTIIDGLVSEVRFQPGGKTAYVVLSGTDYAATLDLGTSAPTGLTIDGGPTTWAALVGYLARARVSVKLQLDSQTYERCVRADFTTEA